jgi:hypothetical protein
MTAQSKQSNQPQSKKSKESTQRATSKGVFALFTLLAMLAVPALINSLRADETPQSLLEMTTTQADLSLVDPELSQANIPKLVLPPSEPPANVRLRELIVKSDEWQGSQCGVVDPRFAVFRHPDKWEVFWTRAMAPISPRLAAVPAVDFAKDMVVGVFMGEKPYPHYDIEIRSIRAEDRPDQGKVLVVRYREIKRMMGVFIPPFKVQPFHMKKVPAFPGQVVFLKVRR